MSARTTIDEREIHHFSGDAHRWWDENGPFAPLHKLNPVRVSYIKQMICAHFERDYNDLNALDGLSALDIGCGGGLVCEPMARMGADVTGADADPQAIETAKEHATSQGLSIRYLNKPAEEIGETFDIVLALEIIEHVADPAHFVESCAKLLKPGGLIIFSTLNRTPKSFALGIVAAEYILRWVPKGTHQWKKFIRPSELARLVRQTGLKPSNISGLTLNPITGEFQISNSDLDVNYFLAAS